MNVPGAARAHYERRRIGRPKQIWVDPYHHAPAPKGRIHIKGALPLHSKVK